MQPFLLVGESEQDFGVASIMPHTEGVATCSKHGSAICTDVLTGGGADRPSLVGKKATLHHAVLIVEQLETRLTPTAFTWVGPNGATSWETPADWSGGDGRTNYPGWNGTQTTTNDTVTFDGTAKTFACAMAQSHTIASLTITGWGLNHIALNGSLTIGNGGSMDSGVIINPGTGATLNFALGTFTWSGGWINYDPSQQQQPQIGYVSISSGATVNVTGTQANNQGLGDNLTNSGLLKLANTATVSLNNRPTITNGGTILITGNNGKLLRPTTDAVVTIQNTGTIQITTGVEYYINEALNMAASTAQLQVYQGKLHISGADPSTGYSILEPAGTIVITAAGGSSLVPFYGIQQTGGTTETTPGSTGTAYIQMGSGNYVMTGGTIQVGDNAPSTPTLDLSANVGAGNLQFNSGTIQLYYDTGAGKSSSLNVEGTTGITVGQTGTTLAVNFSSGTLPNSFDCMFAPNGSISGLCATNPSGCAASRTNNNHNYTLTKRGSSPLLALSDLVSTDRSSPPANPSSQSPPLSSGTSILVDRAQVSLAKSASASVLSQFAPWWTGSIDFGSGNAGSSGEFQTASLVPPDQR
jgi:hypothetical protein